MRVLSGLTLSSSFPNVWTIFRHPFEADSSCHHTSLLASTSRHLLLAKEEYSILVLFTTASSWITKTRKWFCSLIKQMELRRFLLNLFKPSFSSMIFPSFPTWPFVLGRPRSCLSLAKAKTFSGNWKDKTLMSRSKRSNLTQVAMFSSATATTYRAPTLKRTI